MQFTEANALAFEKKLIDSGYKKYFQDFKRSDFCLWKTFEKEFDEDGDSFGGYMVGFAFYDYTKYPQYNGSSPISVSYNFLMGSDPNVDRLDMTVSDDKMTLKQFEKFCHDFYKMWKKRNENILMKTEVTN
jgi:hypothetical protein